MKNLDTLKRFFTKSVMKNACAVFTDGFEEIELIATTDVLLRAGVDIKLASAKNELEVKGAHGIKIIADTTIDKIKDEDFDVMILPGGPGSFSLKDDENILDFVRKFDFGGKLVCAICAAPIILHNAGILENKKYCSHPCVHDALPSVDKSSRVVTDENLITAIGPGASIDFALAIITKLFGQKRSDEIKKDLLYK